MFFLLIPQYPGYTNPSVGFQTPRFISGRFHPWLKNRKVRNSQIAKTAASQCQPIEAGRAIACVMSRPVARPWIRKSAPFVRPFPTLNMPGESKPLKCLAILTPASVLVVKLKKPALILRRSQIA
ncbi:hypothetical protein MARHY1771 [Marinobacter nauticus ATCC 49840]|nr:hypothetical protein MARHY1771 [Marinobacter nauticus ATCC 49840]